MDCLNLKSEHLNFIKFYRTENQSFVIAEKDAIKLYNDAVALTSKLGDNGTKVLTESILTDEEGHIDWIEEQLDQIEQMGYERYLNKQA